MRSDAVQVGVLIGCVFVFIVTDSEIYYIYKVILQTINSVVRTPSNISKLVATNYIFNKARLNINLLLFRVSKLI
jgi:hypothetical protein